MTTRAKLALGTVQFGLAYGVAGAQAAIGVEDARVILRAAADAGIERLDTAPAYGEIEARLAELIQGLPFTVVSKIPALPEGGDQCDFVRQSIQQSVRRLGPNLVGMLFHDSTVLAKEDGIELWATAQATCREHGLELGVSCYDPADAAALAQDFPIGMVQAPGNAFDQRFHAVAERVPGEVTVRSIFLQGLLLLTPEEAMERVPLAAAAVAPWRQWCRSAGLTPLEAAIGVAHGLGAAYCVVGVDRLPHLREILAAWNTPEIRAPELALSDADIIDPRLWPAQRQPVRA